MKKMNEKNEELLELLKVMKDLHGNGFHLTKEISAVIKLLLSNSGLSKEDVYGKKENKAIELLDGLDKVIKKQINSSVSSQTISPY
jgi:hypothetical protein